MQVREPFRKNQQLHVPTLQQVVKMLCRADASQESGLVIDPFAGSGSTGVAAVSLGCRFVGVDTDPVFEVHAHTKTTAYVTLLRIQCIHKNSTRRNVFANTLYSQKHHDM
jgi:16S rRNA G966 N2-methylase RsmD